MHSSSTTTTTYVQEANTRNDQNGNQNTIVRILKLSPQKMVRWDESTVDNENAQKKSSKGMSRERKKKCQKKDNLCCIYHKPKGFGESSDSDSDSSVSDGTHSENEEEKGKTIHITYIQAYKHSFNTALRVLHLVFDCTLIILLLFNR
ncbi:protein phosphatase inhibitor 3, putative [Plasmodium ovale curtisi]|uniref:Protein phosphatase inhibitor 3, putative n=1 Tax=Plasmodium ovale curtisi TaxID=864141 RepID=A0A1A8VUZ3_PLAOA|nr:protein phosphatase inhibitor 3, putative [Plasmodium ovale curtisi]